MNLTYLNDIILEYLFLFILLIFLITTYSYFVGVTYVFNNLIKSEEVEIDSHYQADNIHVLNLNYLSGNSELYNNHEYTIANYENFGRNIINQRYGNIVSANYSFPLFGFKTAEFRSEFNPLDISEKLTILRSENYDDENYILKITELYSDIGEDIAYLIIEELNNERIDNYKNRIISALNFVQYIPYGVQKNESFKKSKINLPHETLILNYGDNNSKSILFTCIIKNLINPDNVAIITYDNVNNERKYIPAVSGLNKNGIFIEHNNKKFYPLETKKPIDIHDKHFEHINVKQIILF